MPSRFHCFKTPFIAPGEGALFRLEARAVDLPGRDGDWQAGHRGTFRQVGVGGRDEPRQLRTQPASHILEDLRQRLIHSPLACSVRSAATRVPPYGAHPWGVGHLAHGLGGLPRRVTANLNCKPCPRKCRTLHSSRESRRVPANKLGVHLYAPSSLKIGTQSASPFGAGDGRG